MKVENLRTPFLQQPVGLTQLAVFGQALFRCLLCSNLRFQVSALSLRLGFQVSALIPHQVSGFIPQPLYCRFLLSAFPISAFEFVLSVLI